MNWNRIGRQQVLAGLTAVLAAAVVSSRAGAAPLSAPPVVSVSVTSGYDYYSFEGSGTALPDGSLSVHDVAHRDNDFDCDWSFSIDPDPSIGGTFKLTNLATTTQSFVMSITLPVAALFAPTLMGGSVGTISLLDSNGLGFVTQDGTATLETNGAIPLYQAQIDGNTVQPLVGTLSLPACCGNGASASFGQVAFGTPIPSANGPAVNSNIGIHVELTLTSGDHAEIPVFFRVEGQAPEPASLSLLGFAGAALVALRRRLVS
jgi:PEP-CTERM motif-containing protein